MKITLIKGIDGKLVPAFNSDYDTAKKIKLNEPFEYEFKMPRNIRFHRKFFGLLNLVVDNTEIFKSVDDLRFIICMEIGYCDYITNPVTGEVVKKPKSISFAKMDNKEFEDLYNKAIDFCCVILLVDKHELINEIAKNF